MFCRFPVRQLVITCLALATVSCGRGADERMREHLALGDEYFAKKQYDAAVIEYRNAVQQDEQSGEARFKLAGAFEASGNLQQAIRAFIRAADLLPDNAEAQLKAADYLLMSGQFEDAQTRAEQVLEKDPKNVQAQIARANALAGLDNLDGAVAQIEEAIALEPERATGYMNLAQVKLAQGKRDEARATFEKAVALEPSSIAALLALANFQLAVGEIVEAEQTLQRTLAIDANQLLAHRALAAIYLTSNRAAAAEPHVIQVARASSPNGQFALADYYTLVGRPADARKILTPLIGDSGAFAGAQLRLAQLDYAEGRRPEAHAMLDEVLAREKGNVAVLMAKAQWLAAEGESRDALPHAMAAVQAEPNSAAAHYLLGRVRALQLDVDAAANEFNEVLRLNPRAVAARLALSQLELHRDRPDVAVELAQGALESSPGNPLARLNVARGFIAQRDLTRADAELRDLLEQYPNASAVHAAAGSLLLARNDLANARRSFEQALALGPASIEALNGLTTVDIREKRVAAARARVDAQLKADPERIELMLLAARVYAADQDAASAERILLRAIQLAPAQISGYTMLAQVYLAQGKLDAARKEFDDLAGRRPRDIVPRTMSALIMDAQNNRPEAKKRYIEILEIDSRAAVAANNLAWIYAEERTDLDYALRLAERAVQLIPQSAEAQDTLGWVYYQKELPALGIASFQRSTELDPENASYRYHLGLAYLKVEERQKARTCLEQALKLDPGFADAERARTLLASLQG